MKANMFHALLAVFLFAEHASVAGQVPVRTDVPPTLEPAAPMGIVLNYSAGNVIVAWNAAKWATGYEVMRTTDPLQPAVKIATLAPTSLGYRDQQVGSGLVYFYQVVSIGAHGARAPSTFFRLAVPVRAASLGAGGTIPAPSAPAPAGTPNSLPVAPVECPPLVDPNAANLKGVARVPGLEALRRDAPGTTGPADPPGPAPESAPPGPYFGRFILEINSARVQLSSFAGCFDKMLGVEYEDCYLQTSEQAPALEKWLGDTVSGANPYRDVTILQLSLKGDGFVSRTRLTQAFLRELRLSDPDAGEPDASVGSMSFVVVPGSISTQRSSGPLKDSQLWSPLPFFRNQLFRMTVDKVDAARVKAVRGLRVTVAKVASNPMGTRRQFQPGSLHFDPIRVEMLLSGSSVEDFSSWADQIANGNGDRRNGQVQWFSQDLQEVRFTAKLCGLLPIAFEPFPVAPSENIRRITLSVGSLLFSSPHQWQ